MPRCAVRDCKTNESNRNVQIFSFPRQCKSVTRRWIKACGRDIRTTRRAGICEEHFSPYCFENFTEEDKLNQRRCLKLNAIPSIDVWRTYYEKRNAPKKKLVQREKAAKSKEDLKETDEDSSSESGESDFVEGSLDEYQHTMFLCGINLAMCNIKLRQIKRRYKLALLANQRALIPE